MMPDCALSKITSFLRHCLVDVKLKTSFACFRFILTNNTCVDTSVSRYSTEINLIFTSDGQL